MSTLSDLVVAQFWLSVWGSVAAGGEQLFVRIERVKAMMPNLIAEASALRAFAELISQGSTPDAVVARAAKADEVDHQARGETPLLGGTMVSKSAHHDLLNRKIEIGNLTQEVERLRRRRTAAGEELGKAVVARDARAAGASPAERQKLEHEAEMQRALAQVAVDNCEEAEERLEKLRTAGSATAELVAKVLAPGKVRPGKPERLSVAEADHYGCRLEFDAWAKATYPPAAVREAFKKYADKLAAAKAARGES